MFKTILVPTDGSEMSGRAIDGAIDHARATGARVIALAVAEPYLTGVDADAPSAAGATMVVHADAEARARLDDFTRRANAAGIVSEIVAVREVDPWRAIVATARQRDCDAIFMGSHGRRGIQGVLIGSETRKVLTHCKLPVLVYR